ncbi:NAD(P)-dependent oxidoreductase [Amycolatopsis rubida]|uniref:NAD(P)-dependent oxidoreductase n=1 Tax=Amycolatopsis rubida TaxID=112413 RepID=A0ABX0C855_9PSEU|nr:NAD(P)-dependent oxidoreductase [Amycolatopsis sp. M39]MYW96102.1 NAD-binding protein [Amycolatopsis rubida]NEC61093.1 NAD(P)-dependent oxidoreductase [Amycolatopsis rubida]OAP23387.1 2-(hydroxymethyl)glutarate dehydrogenase [Amycolatopsis sp. M39]
MAIGYVGLGNMGGPLAARLAPGGDLRVFDLNPDAVERLVAGGATAASGLAHLAADCDVVFLCLPTSAQVRAAIFEDGGLAGGLKPGSIVVDQTSGDPRETREIAARLAELEVDLVDAPVSGGPLRAAEGTIAIMVGATAQLYERVAPILGRISPNLFHAGGPGNGHLVKLVNNLVSGIIRWATLEGVALAAKHGVEPGRAVEIMSAGGARNDWLVAVMGPQVVRGDLSNGFSVGLAHKDLKLACELGQEAGVPLLVGNVTREIYRMCINEMGFDTKVDSTALMMDRLAGTHVVPAEYRFA